MLVRTSAKNPRFRRTWLLVLGGLAGGLAMVTPLPSARAFCGFYVSGAEGSLYANATMVVLMREGTRTVLSMQNSYQGPAEDFAMVVPVPQVLSEDNVKTLPREIFTRVDQLAAPRLVEYWEQDPCAVRLEYEEMSDRVVRGPPMPTAAPAPEDDTGVTVEAAFAVGEYDIVILSARDSSGLDTWLRREQYNIPEGAGEVLRPYVESGTKFFVAKVDVERAEYVNGKAVLSPLRVHYDSSEFSLPVRLGLLNSDGEQDLLVHVLSRNTRYEVANYENAFIPTNIRVLNEVRDRFAPFYDTLFSRAIAGDPNTVVTEYSWDASSCDPCPTTPLQPNELQTLGTDVIPGSPSYGFVLTRLHYRYSPSSLGEDLVFRAATPMVGGRGTPDRQGKMRERTAQSGGINNFQGRYIILHRWDGAMECENPMRGEWGGPPGTAPAPMPGAPPTLAAPPATSKMRSSNAAGAPAPMSIGALVEDSIPSLGITAGVAEALPVSEAVSPRETVTSGGRGDAGCASCRVGGPLAPGGSLLLSIGVACALVRRRRR